MPEEVKQDVATPKNETIENENDEAGRGEREKHIRRVAAVAKATGVSITEAEKRVAAEEGKLPKPEPPPATFKERADRLWKARARSLRTKTSIPQAEAEIAKGAA
jgi:hypothetical protein